MQYWPFVKYELIIVRYGEIALKAKATRRHFENYLIDNIRNALKTSGIYFRIKREWSRIYVYTRQINKSVDVLQKIFGITSISPAIQTQSNMSSISNLAVNISKNTLIDKKTFAIRVTRTGEHKYSSQDVAVKIGDDIVKATKAGVNLTNPDFELFIEIRNENAYLFTEKMNCNGGFPLGTQGKVLVMIDSIESILAAWYIMRRGCKPVFLNADESLSDVLSTFIDKWYADKDVIIVDTNKPIYRCINDAAYMNGCVNLVTGHSLYSASGDVLSDLKLLNEQVNVSILHPLIAMEKEEINNKIKEIGLSS